MAAKGKAQRYVFKIHSARLKEAKYNLNLTIDEAKANNELIALSESQLIRFIDELNNIPDCENEINNIRAQIKKLKNNPDIVKSRPVIKNLYKQLYEYLFKPDYVNIVMDNKAHYDEMFKDGFILNGEKYQRLLGTSGGVKNSTIVFVSSRLWPSIDKKINNGRDLTKEFIPAKFEAYKGLVCSSSIEVTNPEDLYKEQGRRSRVVVVHDVITKFKSTVIKLDDTDTVRPDMQIIEDYENELDNSDGYGMASPELMKRWGEDLKLHYMLPGCVIRNAFLKGAVVPINYKEFAHNHGIDTITDVWGKTYNIDEVELILTDSMLKLWDSYDSYERYAYHCKNNGYTYAITKACDYELEKTRNMNYQFLQSYEFTDEDIEELIAPTVNEIDEILSGDYRKTILYTKGMGLNEYNVQHLTGDFASALMIEPQMANDPFIIGQVRSMINKRIQDAKVGVLKVRGNYAMAVGDPYSLCQSMLGLEVTGLLKAGEVYSNEWRNMGVDKIACFRAPMTCHNNIRVMNILSNNDEADEFYKYITTPIIINSWDNFQDAENGEDFDADANICTDCDVIVRNTKNLPAIVCIQRKGKKEIPTEENLFESNKNSFGNEIGAVTNRITTMFEVQSNFEKGSKEYEELDYRIKCGQLYQQATIDKIKGIDCKPMPEEWYTWISNKIEETDSPEIVKEKQFNRTILADKKPYFMRYVYARENTKFREYLKKRDIECKLNFHMTVEELSQLEILNEKQQTFLDYFYKKLPLGIGNCTINRICYRIEELYDNVSFIPKDSEFDYTIMKSNVPIKECLIKKIKEIYKDYKEQYNCYKKKCRIESIDSEESQITKYIMTNDFKQKCIEVCPDAKMLCDILLDLCYQKGKGNKQFVWDMCGDVIIENLLEKNDYKISYPTRDDQGDLEFNGLKFKMVDTVIKRKEEILDATDYIE